MLLFFILGARDRINALKGFELAQQVHDQKALFSERSESMGQILGRKVWVTF